MLNPHIDEVIETYRDPSDIYTTIQYISSLHHRSIHARTYIQDALEDFPYNDVKDIHWSYITHGTRALGMFPIEDYKGGVLQSIGNNEYIISDSPVIRINIPHFIKRINIDETDKYPKEWLYVCPLSPEVCGILYHKESVYFEDFSK